MITRTPLPIFVQQIDPRALVMPFSLPWSPLVFGGRWTVALAAIGSGVSGHGSASGSASMTPSGSISRTFSHDGP